MCDDSCAIIPPLLLQYYEVKIQMLLASSWNQLLKRRGTSKYKFSYFQKRPQKYIISVCREQILNFPFNTRKSSN